ncbi:MAG: hypothetical protein QW785_02970 [Candidatus Anstonellales archaeon]
MKIEAAIAITNKNILTSYATLIYSTLLFYIALFGMLGTGVILYSFYGIFLEIPVLLLASFFIFFPGYLYSQFDQFIRVIRRDKRSFNRITDLFILGSLKSLPITIIKLLITSMLMIPSIVILLYLHLDIITIALIASNYLFASAITEYLFSYVYYYYLIVGRNLIKSLVDGLKESLSNINKIPVFFLNYVLSLIQIIPVINMTILFLIPWIYVLSVGNMFKR